MRPSRRGFITTMGAAAIASAVVRPLRAVTESSGRLARFNQAKFGMFIHWGPYSVAGVEASWPILRPDGQITEAEYRALPQRFNPVKFERALIEQLARGDSKPALAA